MSWFTDHYEQVYSSCCEGQYVADCIKRNELPGKYRKLLEPLGIEYRKTEMYANCDEWESHVPVTLPDGWIMKKKGRSTLVIEDNNGKIVFEASVVDSRGYQTWTAKT